MRLLAAGAPDKAGHLRGALEIRLKPGWKTYWRDPGTAGVPPSIDLTGSTNVASAEFGFPAPERHDDGYGAWAGYSQPVTFAVTFTIPEPTEPWHVEANVFLGLCREICVPVSARFSLRSGEAGDPQAVAQGFAALPLAASNGFGITEGRIEGEAALLDARLPDGSAEAPELFVAGENGFVFGVPEPQKSGKGWRFKVPLFERPAAGGSVPVFYTLRAGAKAVSGTFVLR